MQALVLDRNLLNSKPGEPASIVAMALTNTTLDQLEPGLKPEILAFLAGLKLIQSEEEKYPIIALAGIDLSNIGQPIGIGFLDFHGADLSMANFTNARIDMSDFTDANLEGAVFEHATFLGCNFSGANLNGVYLTGVNIWKAGFDEKTILPNGKLWDHNDMVKEFGAVIQDPYTDHEYHETLKELGYSENGISKMNSGHNEQ